MNLKTAGRRSARSIALMSLVVFGGCVAAQPAFAAGSAHRYCYAKADFAMTVAAMHQSGIPLREVLAELSPENAAMKPLARTAYDLSSVARGKSPAHKAAAVGDTVYLSCMIQHGGGL